MLERSDSFDFDKLKGKVLDQICVGIYQVAFRFENGVSISCESSLYVINQERSSKDLVFPLTQRSSESFGLLGRAIEIAEIREDRALHVAFDRGIAIQSESDSNGYESFEVWVDQDFLIS